MVTCVYCVHSRGTPFDPPQTRRKKPDCIFNVKDTPVNESIHVPSVLDGNGHVRLVKRKGGGAWGSDDSRRTLIIPENPHSQTNRTSKPHKRQPTLLTPAARM